MNKWKTQRVKRVKAVSFVITFFSVSLVFIGICRLFDKGSKSMETVVADEKCYIDIEGLSQDGIPTGCEAVSAVMVLNYYGVDITAEEFINAYLPMGDFYKEGDVVYGPNPEEKFAGNPFVSSSLGCYPPVIVQAIENMRAEGADVEAFELRGESLENICKEYIENDAPVLVWVTMDMCKAKDGYKYFLEDGTKYTWAAGEHCMVLCGFDEEYYYLKDPLKAGKTVKYEKELVKKRYEEMGKRGVVIKIRQ